jgi:hypothetical protein
VGSAAGEADTHDLYAHCAVDAVFIPYRRIAGNDRRFSTARHDSASVGRNGTEQGDKMLEWDARGTVTCEPVDFAPGKFPEEPESRTPQAGDETPAAAPAPARAVASAPPFPLLMCATPFAPAGATHAVEPDFPRSVGEQGFSRTATSEIAVAIDPQGKLVEAWVWATSGYPALDDAALSAARRSQYSGAISYCRPVSGTYLFRADFAP